MKKWMVMLISIILIANMTACSVFGETTQLSQDSVIDNTETSKEDLIVEDTESSEKDILNDGTASFQTDSEISSETDVSADTDAFSEDVLENTDAYSEDVSADTDALTEDVSADNDSSSENAGDSIAFSTKDINGRPITGKDIKNAKLVMVNFWEPWCGPCVGEMPDLEKLYENYQDQGLIILGVFYSSDYQEEAKAIVDEIGITYPVLIGNQDFSAYTTQYVPTTVFFTGSGELLTDEPFVGARSYTEWEQEVIAYFE